MKFYLIEITTYMNETPDAKGVYAHDSEIEAVANFHSKMGGAMKNENYATELVQVINEAGRVIKTEYFVRPVVAPEPEVAEPTEEA